MKMVVNTLGLQNKEHISCPFLDLSHYANGTMLVVSSEINASTAKELRTLADQAEMAWLEYERRSKKDVA